MNSGRAASHGDAAASRKRGINKIYKTSAAASAAPTAASVAPESVSSISRVAAIC